jgi:hypothetical protein
VGMEIAVLRHKRMGGGLHNDSSKSHGCEYLGVHVSRVGWGPTNKSGTRDHAPPLREANRS